MQPKTGLRITVAFKFFLLFTCLGAFLLAFNIGVLLYMTGHQPAIRHTLHQIVEFVADSMGVDPTGPVDIQRLRTHAAKLGVDIEVRTSTGVYSTLASPLDREALLKKARPLSFGEPAQVVRDSSTGRFLISIARPGFEATFIAPKGHWVEMQGAAMGFVLAVTMLSLFVSFLMARYLLSPLKPLTVATQHFKSGDLNHRIESRSRDEFGDLARSFNDMAEHLGGMIRNKEQLLLDVSHELRTPLTRMRIALELMPDMPRKQDLVEDVHEMDVMVNDLLEAHRLQNPYGSLHKEAVDIPTLLHQIAARYEDRKPGLAIQPGPSHVTIEADPTRILSLVRNVIDNAMKYSAEQNVPVEVSFRDDGDDVFITVRDHGPGIPPGELEKVFEPFYRVDKSRTRATGGFGLGLPLCRNIALAHGGELALANAEGGGLVAIIRLPRRASPAPSSDLPSRTSHG